jgi:hypothetical protein
MKRGVFMLLLLMGIWICISALSKGSAVSLF